MHHLTGFHRLPSTRMQNIRAQTVKPPTCPVVCTALSFGVIVSKDLTAGGHRNLYAGHRRAISHTLRPSLHRTLVSPVPCRFVRNFVRGIRETFLLLVISVSVWTSFFGISWRRGDARCVGWCGDNGAKPASGGERRRVGLRGVRVGGRETHHPRRGTDEA